MTHGSLFSGIGGFDLAAEWMSWENVFHCEWNEFGKKILTHYWPKSISYHDITKTDFTIHRGSIDILTGGFPCQPYSMAGKRKGKNDERHLWPEMLRAIREIQPRWVVGENVFGLINWNGGMVFNEVQTDLEAAGYEVWPYVLPACSINAPHRRDRVWFVAYANRSGNNRTKGGTGSIREQSSNKQTRYRRTSKINRFNDEWPHSNPYSDGQHSSNSEHEIEPSKRGEYALNDIEPVCDVAYTNHNERRSAKGGRVKENEAIGADLQQSAARFSDIKITTNTDGNGGRKNNRQRKSELTNKNSKINDWSNFPTQSPVCIGNDGLSTKLDRITFSKWRNESIKAAGNAIVPQVVYQIFKAIKQYESNI